MEKPQCREAEDPSRKFRDGVSVDTCSSTVVRERGMMVGGQLPLEATQSLNGGHTSTPATFPGQ